LERAQIIEGHVAGRVLVRSKLLNERALSRLPGTNQHHDRRVVQRGQQSRRDGAGDSFADIPSHSHSGHYMTIQWTIYDRWAVGR